MYHSMLMPLMTRLQVNHSRSFSEYMPKASITSGLLTVFVQEFGKQQPEGACASDLACNLTVGHPLPVVRSTWQLKLDNMPVQ